MTFYFCVFNENDVSVNTGVIKAFTNYCCKTEYLRLKQWMDKVSEMC